MYCDDTVSPSAEQCLLGTSSRRRGTVSHFLVGVRNDSADGEGGNGDKGFVFSTVGRVGSGYTVEELRALQERLGPHWVDFSASHPPAFLDKSITYTGVSSRYG